jgi:broad specificity phosphatase PhoE
MSESGAIQGFPSVDQRLDELDYGVWSGLTDKEIKARFGVEAYENWTNHGLYPDNANWKPLQAEVKQEVLSFLDDLLTQFKSDETILAVSSGGRLRYFLLAIPDQFEKHQSSKRLKTATGHVSVLNYQDNKWSLSVWNADPADAFSMQL